MPDEKTTTPAAPDVDPGPPSDERDEEIQQLHKADLETDIRRLDTEVHDLHEEIDRLNVEKAALQVALDEARGVHKPVEFPCAVYRGAGTAIETAQANDPVELEELIASGWSETPK